MAIRTPKQEYKAEEKEDTFEILLHSSPPRSSRSQRILCNSPLSKSSELLSSSLGESNRHQRNSSIEKFLSDDAFVETLRKPRSNSVNSLQENVLPKPPLSSSITDDLLFSLPEPEIEPGVTTTGMQEEDDEDQELDNQFYPMKQVVKTREELLKENELLRADVEILQEKLRISESKPVIDELWTHFHLLVQAFKVRKSMESIAQWSDVLNGIDSKALYDEAMTHSVPFYQFQTFIEEHCRILFQRRPNHVSSLSTPQKKENVVSDANILLESGIVSLEEYSEILSPSNNSIKGQDGETACV